MRLLRFEFKKLFSSKGILLLVSALLAANIVLCFFYPITTAEKSNEEYIAGYKSDVQRVVRLAELNKSDLSDGDGGYIIDYQEKVIEKYSALIDAGQVPQTIKGYGEFISFTGKITFMLVLAVVISSMVALNEKDAGMKPFLFISKKGKRVQSVKLLTLFILSAAISVVYTTINLAVTGFKYGLSGLFSPVVSVQAMELCPYRISIFGYIVILFFLSCIISFALAVFTALIGKLSGGYILTFLCSGTVCTILYVNGFDLNDLFIRFRAVNMFDKAVDFLPVFVTIVTCICAVLCVLFYLVGGRQTTIGEKLRKTESNLFDKIHRVFKKTATAKPHQAKRHSLFVYELKKIFISSKLILLVILLVGAKIYYCVDNLSRDDLYEKEYYRLCTKLSGELTFEKSEYIASELSECGAVISRHDEMLNKKQSGLITSEEYNEYLTEFYTAEVKQSAFSRLNEQKDHIEILRTKGGNAEIVYDTSWKTLLLSGFDIFLYALILLLFAGIYTFEYKNGMDKLLLSVKSGGRKLDRAKIISSLLVTTTLCLIFITIDIVFTAIQYPIKNMLSPASSIIGLSFEGGAPLLLYLILFVFKKIVGFALFSVTVCLSSKLLRKPYLIIPVVISITLLPHLLFSNLPFWLDFTKLL